MCREKRRVVKNSRMGEDGITTLLAEVAETAYPWLVGWQALLVPGLAERRDDMLWHRRKRKEGPAPVCEQVLDQ